MTKLTRLSHSRSLLSSMSTSSFGPRSSSPRSPSSRACTRLASRRLSLGMKLSKQSNTHLHRRSLTRKQLRQIRLPLPQARVLLRCPPSPRKDAGRSVWIPRWIQRFIRVQVWRDISRGAELYFHAPLQLCIWRRLRTIGLFHSKGTELQKTYRLVRHAGRSLRKLVHHH